MFIPQSLLQSHKMDDTFTVTTNFFIFVRFSIIYLPQISCKLLANVSPPPSCIAIAVIYTFICMPTTYQFFTISVIFGLLRFVGVHHKINIALKYDHPTHVILYPIQFLVNISQISESARVCTTTLWYISCTFSTPLT